jgi:glutamine phosphoribosylpyrophosphate amidotransferase
MNVLSLRVLYNFDKRILIMSDASETEANDRNTYLLQEDNKVLSEALRQCRDQFKFYADEHTAAGKTEKAATNARFADIASKALTTTKHNGKVTAYDQLVSTIEAEHSRMKKSSDDDNLSELNRHGAFQSMHALRRVLKAVGISLS